MKNIDESLVEKAIRLMQKRKSREDAIAKIDKQLLDLMPVDDRRRCSRSLAQDWWRVVIVENAMKKVK